jgi:hypothetical protein
MFSDATSDAFTRSDRYLSLRPACQGASANTLKGVGLNAFRHHGERDRRHPPGAGGGAPGCSTPFGITASGTRTSAPTRRRSSCSTPFGITASGTLRPDSPVLLATYLPPFKHPHPSMWLQPPAPTSRLATPWNAWAFPHSCTYTVAKGHSPPRKHMAFRLFTTPPTTATSRCLIPCPAAPSTECNPTPHPPRRPGWAERPQASPVSASAKQRPQPRTCAHTPPPTPPR